MAALFQGIKGIIYYLDDVLISGRTEEEHNTRLVKVLDIILENGLKANMNKRKNKRFEWGEAQERSFEKLKIKMVEKPILNCFNEKLDIILTVDASNEGIGGVLLQMTDDVEKPILFLSRRFSSTEKNYSTIEREALAVKFGLEKCKEYLIGRRFILYTDHKPLVDLFKKENKELMMSPRLQRWLILGNFDFEIRFRAGKQNCLPDILSRLFKKDSANKDTVINSLEYIEEEEKLNSKVIRALKIDKREEPITFWWPNMIDGVVKFINSCDTCQRCNTRFDKTTNELQSIPARTKVWSQIGVNMCTLTEREDGYKYIAVAVDYFGKYVVAMPLKDKTAKSISKFLYLLLFTYGKAKIQINDQGREFVNEVSTNYHKLMGTMQRVTSAYHPELGRSSRKRI
ncbi:uncharacterized protein LOC135923020 [Gordionus sp. m RMFG-2023]|uniref:uncharacterized protein LOC135923020 n=1 Tax=Gordionus sp. m RMFG-2023 TaxID=3053472 RepID=UPI0031FE1450